MMMLAGIARGLRFTRAERDRLFSAAGYDSVDGALRPAHVEPGLMHVLDRLADTPALAIDPIGQVLHQTPPAAVLFGELTTHKGWERNGYYRWFTSIAERRRFTAAEQFTIGSEIAADLHHRLQDNESSTLALDLVQNLLSRSVEFADHWQAAAGRGAVLGARRCRVIHADIGEIEMYREVLSDNSSGQRLVTYLAAPGSEGYSKLQLLSVISRQRLWS
jgi:hypothetical protein